MPASSGEPVAWSRVDVASGLGLGTLLPQPHGFRLEASETVAGTEERYASRFTVHADLAWVSRAARVEVLSGAGPASVELRREAAGWTVNGRRRAELDGCLDVDVAATPLTNTLPIRRLGLRPGEYRDISVVRIDVPSLGIQRLTRRYTRLYAADGQERYEYSDPLNGSFVLTVDRDGLVVDHEGLARRLR
ncbi:putative glycolipid-binding domain-containing protein [Streptomonospora nanhaiensis]|uniref:Glycolipid-binding family protein n=1 Tax=Streptomonospora nanhaiensis TaxID=1323731 RepID=A0A853BNQ4_9ACTN|nr:putative glycolipid-binding domain-containing protein [Streptomonospora nanhaiensis]MBV2364916.1 putative glycolipid-binding domain-containing protein [Streptomonospora nanhaiensis]MBX9391111.1 putative glycolipid-binding domain-containing protein [Streptomonospora nanhaiensis]NYI97259.1 hypothetical protein [Streptomonospora nanhaiensis]